MQAAYHVQSHALGRQLYPSPIKVPSTLMRTATSLLLTAGATSNSSLQAVTFSRN